ncbi:MAG: DUF4351 domain-containing protein, partial [Blastocatellia bacterium]|nr:DUF4351 domain-containing protein [Blastocatellia bacterium]
LHEQIEGAFEVVMEQMPRAGMKERVIVFIHYLLKSGKATEREVGQAVRRINEAKGAEIMETAYDKILNKGLQQGLQQGSQQTALKMTLRLLRKRFGRIESRTEAKVVSLSTEKLEELGEALLDFEKPEDLKTWLKEHSAK